MCHISDLGTRPHGNNKDDKLVPFILCTNNVFIHVHTCISRAHFKECSSFHFLATVLICHLLFEAKRVSV